VRALGLWLCAGLASGCGYSVVQNRQPFGLTTIAVVPFAEDEAVGIAADLAQELSQQLAAGGTGLALSESGADGVLSGTVLAARTGNSPVSRIGQMAPSSSLVVMLDVVLRSHGREVWRRTVNVADDYLPGGGYNTALLATETNRREALRRIAGEAARQIYKELLYAGLGKATAARASLPAPVQEDASDQGKPSP
jgi:hypothetical protein